MKKKFKFKLNKKTFQLVNEFDKIIINKNGKNFEFKKAEIDKLTKKSKKFYPQFEEIEEEDEKKEFLVKSDIIGIVSKIYFREKEIVKKNELVILISAMKVENEILSPVTGKIQKIFVKENQEVKEGTPLFTIVRQ